MTTPPVSPAEIAVEFRFLIDGEAFPASHLEPRDLLVHWLADSRLRCCSILGGFVISAKGRAWNADCLDEVSMAGGWLHGVLSLLEGASQVRTWV